MHAEPRSAIPHNSRLICPDKAVACSFVVTLPIGVMVVSVDSPPRSALQTHSHRVSCEGSSGSIPSQPGSLDCYLGPASQELLQ
eukprot:scaffold173458_cov41-Prasinocladus_malaysianus.AAC.2